MSDRPAILTARVEEIAHAEQCKTHQAAKDKSNRPGTASLDEVRSAAQDTLHAVQHAGGSVAAVKGIDCPCVRLGADSCEVQHE